MAHESAAVTTTTNASAVALTEEQKARLLFEMWTDSRTARMYFGNEQLTLDGARQLLAEARADERKPYFDYVFGRVIKTNLDADPSDRYTFVLFDRDNGPGAGAAALDRVLRSA